MSIWSELVAAHGAERIGEPGYRFTPNGHIRLSMIPDSRERWGKHPSVVARMVRAFPAKPAPRPVPDPLADSNRPIGWTYTWTGDTWNRD